MPAPPPDTRFADMTDVDWDEVKPPDARRIPLPVVQPSDHYRPSAALDTFIRMRDLTCTWPGCDKSAWKADLDHTAEYNHADPEAGGRTRPSGMKALCRFHHMLKTHTDWLDDQFVDEHGRTRATITTPEGRTYEGSAWSGEDLFPALKRIIWDYGPTTTSRRPDNPMRHMPRTEAKHLRRQQERKRNRRRREAHEDADGPPPF